jgi:hypothetical protein
VKNPAATDEANKTPTVSIKEVKNANAAEKAAMEFILNRFPKSVVNVQKVSYGVVGNKEIWSVEGNMRVKTGMLSSEMRPFKVQISSSEEVMAYEF